MAKKFSPATLLAAICAGAPTAVTAQGRIEEVIVTAQKSSDRLQDVPATITTQSAEQLANAGITSTADLSAAVPGMVFATNEAFVQPSIRGVSGSGTSAGAENPIAIYVDGIYQPAQTGALFDLPDVERIEALKGPQGTLFGRNATGGALLIYTKEPSHELTGKVEATAGFYEGGPQSTWETGVKGFVSLPVVDNMVAMSLSAFYREHPGYMENDVGGKQAGSARSQGFRWRLRVDPADDLEILLTAYYTTSKDHAAYNRAPYKGFTVAAFYPDAVVPTKPWHTSQNPNRGEFYADTQAKGAALRIDYTTDFGAFTSLTGYTKIDNTDYVEATAAFSPLCRQAARCPQYDLAFPNEAISQEIDFVSEPFFDIFTVTGGLFYYHNMGAQSNVDGFRWDANQQNVRYFGYRSEATSEASAIFAELTAQVTDGLSLVFGGRFNHEFMSSDGEVVAPVPRDEPNYARTDDDSFTKRFSAIYTLSADTNTYFTYSEGFKSGINPNPSLVPPNPPSTEPERIEAYEVGVKTAGPFYSANISYFHYKYEDMQQTVFVGALSFPRNAASATINGIDFDGTLALTDEITVSTSLSYIPKAEFDDYPNAVIYSEPFGPAGFVVSNGNAKGERLLRTPEFTGNLAINWEHEFGIGKVGATATLYHSSHFVWDLASVIVTDAYDDVGLRLFIEPAALQGVRATLFGKNLLNEEHVVGAQPSNTVAPVIYGPPRQIGVSVAYEF